MFFFKPLDSAQDIPPGTAIVIDNGAYTIKAGWACEEMPRVVIRNRVIRNRSSHLSKTYTQTYYVGHEVTPDILTRPSMHAISPFGTEELLLTQAEAMVVILDYVFRALGLGKQLDAVDHPVVMTEPLCNPALCRAQMSKLLIQRYGATSVCYGVADIFSYHYKTNKKGKEDALIVGCGHSSIRLIPFCAGRIRMQQLARLDMGARHCVQQLQSLLITCNPHLESLLTTPFCTALFVESCFVATGGYAAALHRLSQKRKTTADSDDDEDIIVQFAVPEKERALTDEELCAQQEKKRLAVERLREGLRKRLEDKKAKKEAQLQSYNDLVSRKCSGALSQSDFLKQLTDGGFEDEQDFHREHKALKRAVAASGGDTKEQDAKEEEEKEEEEEDKYPLVDVSDSELDEDQRTDKKRQVFLKRMEEAQVRIRIEKQLQREKEEKAALEEDALRQADPVAFLANLKARRLAILKAKRDRERTRLRESQRRGGSAKRRIRMLAAMGHTDREEAFGRSDDDWNVYRDAALPDRLAADENGEAEQDELQILERKIELYSPQEYNDEATTVRRKYQLRVGPARVRATEIIFQPHLAQQDQAGLGEAASRVLKRLPADLSALACSHIFLTGGLANLPQLAARVFEDVRSHIDEDQQVCVTVASNPTFDAWNGARALASDVSGLASVSMTGAELSTHGWDFLKAHAAANCTRK